MELGDKAERRDVVAFYALTTFAALMYVLPQVWFPALAPLRLALLTSGLAAGFMALRRVGRAEPLYFDGIRGGALLCFSALAMASVAWSVNPEVSRFTAIELFKLTAIYLTLVNVITTPKRLAAVCGAVVLGSIVTSYGVIHEHFTGTAETLVEGYRAHWVEVYADPNRSAMNLAIIVPLAVAFVARKETGWLWRSVCLVSIVMAAVAIVFTYSRGGFIGLSVAMAVWALREKKRMRSVFLGIALALGFVIFAPKTFWERNETVTTFHQDASAMGRVYAWQVTSRISLDKPLLGVGAGSFRFAWPLYAPPEATRAYVAHNIFLDVIGELGWVGLLFFLVFAGSATGGAFEASRDSRMGWIARGLAASMTGYLICDLFSGYILSAHLYVLFGLAASAQRIAQGFEARVTEREQAEKRQALLTSGGWEGGNHAT
ncbi:O-antigen ligase family protein [Melittangium boletus]|uniref:Exopolysaccharide biosynthesis protein ExoQ n=1 Tax=Melittangium boletus DSM 14713 TaxID=1294270 RepID=A0A286NUQ8_9BACT|nr:O-antigen ligase family protein [Melittangium boletus]ATB26715.1 exopolysaccharide biosynthesis protein ExoQ [Melittangium boletus DSM 14713]